MAVKIKLKRLGKIRNPQFRVVIADSKTARNGRSIEEIGIYYPKEEPSRIEINSERALYWLGVGAQPTEAVMVLLKITGDWQKFKGLPGTEGTLKVKAAKVDKRSVFAAAVEDAAKTKSEPEAKPKKKVEEVVEKSEPVIEAVSEEVVTENVTSATESAGEESTSE